MNIYRCNFQDTSTYGTDDFAAVTLHIVAETRGKARSYLHWAARDAGFEVEWTYPTNIHLLAKHVDMPEGVDEKFTWAYANIPNFYVNWIDL